MTFTAGEVGTLTLHCTATVGASMASTSADVTIVATPVAAITAPASVVTGVAGGTATVASQSGETFAWTISNGTITAGATSNSITFTGGDVGALGLTCVVTSSATNSSTSGFAVVSVVPALGNLALTIHSIAPNATVAITGPSNYSAQINTQTSVTLTDLVPGQYTVTPGSTTFQGQAFTGSATTTTVTVAAGATATDTVTYTASNTAPQVGSIDDQSFDLDGPIASLPFTLQDNEDPLLALSLSASSSVDGVLSDIEFTTDGVNEQVVLTPGATLGTTLVTITATDSQGLATSQSFNVTTLPVVSSADNAGRGTLRDLVANITDGTTITFEPALSGSVILLTSRINTAFTTSIAGPGAAALILDGGGTSGIILMTDDAGSLTVSGLTFRQSTNSVNSFGDLFVDSCLFTDDVGIENTAFTGRGTSIEITNSTIMGNIASSGPVITLFGTTAIIDNCTFSGDIAYEGTLIASNESTLATISNSAFEFNGQSNLNFSNNSGTGGVIANFGKLDVINSTFYGDESSGDGAILDNGGPATFEFVTITASALGGALFAQESRANTQNTPSLTIKNSILAGNSVPDFSIDNLANNNAVTSGDFNVLTDETMGGSFTSASHDIFAGSADLSFPNNNGGATDTIAIDQASVAHGAIPAVSCTDAQGNAVTTDQRGLSRPTAGACDIGAFELQP